MHAIDLRSKQLEKEAGLTVPQLLVMQSLLESGKSSATQIAREVNLSPGTITSLLNRLEAKGCIRRERDSADRRVISVRLTGDGRRRLENAPSLLQEEFVDRFERLEPWERKMLTSAVERVASLMDAGRLEASPILQIGKLLGQEESAAGKGPDKAR